MKTSKSNKGLTALHFATATLLWFSTMPAAWADATTAPTTAPAAPVTSPFQTCKEANPGNKQAIFQCIRAARKAAYESCLGTLNPAPTPGQKLTKAERKEVHQCMKAKGFRRHHGRGGEENGSTASK